MKSLLSFHCHKLLWLAIGILVFSSCNVYHFEKPQPINTENIYSFPGESLGTWQDQKGETTIIITKNSMTLQGFDSIDLINGIASQEHDLRYRRKNTLKSIRLNKQTGQMDTVPNFIIKGDKIFEIKEGGLGAGYAFTTKADKIYFRRDIIINFELNQKAFLRKLTDRYYILNIYEENLWPLFEGDVSVGPWWQIALLELSTDHKIFIRTLDDTTKQKASLIYSNGSDYYFDAAWTRSELISLTDQGLFEKSEPLQRVSKPARK